MYHRRMDPCGFGVWWTPTATITVLGGSGKLTSDGNKVETTVLTGSRVWGFSVGGGGD